MFESNEFIKKGFNIEIGSIPHEEQKIFNGLIKERVSEFHNLEKIINTNNLMYKYQTEEICPKEFFIYQNPIDLLKNLRDGNNNPKEVLKNKLPLNYI